MSDTVDLAITPGGRVGDDSPIGKPGGRQNWVDKAGGLPKYMRMIAHALIRKGMPAGRAISTAHEHLERLAATSKNPAVKAAAAQALAEWEAKKKGGRATDLSAPVGDAVDLAPGDYRPPYDWKHGYIPITPAAKLSKAKKAPFAGKGRTRKVKGPVAERLAKATDDAKRGRGVPGELESARNAANASGPRKPAASMTDAELVTAKQAQRTTAEPKKLASDRVLLGGEQFERVEGPDGRLTWRGDGNMDVTDADIKAKLDRAAPASGSAVRAAQRARPENRQATVSGRPQGGAQPSDADAEETRRMREARTDRPTSSTRSTNPDAAIRVEHGPDGTTVSGTTREDAADLKAAGFKWSRNMDGWYLPRTWGESTREQRVRQLEAKLGDRVGVDRTTGPRKSAAEREQEKRERAAGRAERMDSRAEKRSAEAERRFEAADLREEKTGIPFGQPILSGHYSERKHRRTLERAHANLGKGVEAQREAESARDAAERARRTASGTESKTTIGNRIQRNEADLRDVDRKLNGTSSQLRGKATGDYRERLLARKADLEDTIAHDKGKLAAAGGTPSRDTVKPDDFVKVNGDWYPVLRSNAKSASIPHWGGLSGGQTVPWHKVQEHRKASEVSREDVANMVQETSKAFPSLRQELAKRAPAKKDPDAPKADAPGVSAAEARDRGVSAGAAKPTAKTSTVRAAEEVEAREAESNRRRSAADAEWAGRRKIDTDPATNGLQEKWAERDRQAARDRTAAQERNDANNARKVTERADELPDSALQNLARSTTQPKTAAAAKAELDKRAAKPDAAPPGKITPDLARRMSDEQLERAMERLVGDGTFSGPSYATLEAELDRRDRARAEGNGRRR